jgi:filamentous hemagglutinin
LLNVFLIRYHCDIDLYTVALEQRLTITNNPNGPVQSAISELGTQPRLICNATEQLSSRVGPYLIGLLTAGTGAALLRGGHIADAIITNVRRAERLVNRPGPDVDAPDAPNPPNTPDRPRPDPERDGGGNGNGDRTNPPDTNDNPNPNNADGGGNGDGRAPETGNNGGNGRPEIRVERVDVNNVQRGTREFELLNNPPPNTRIELSNGNVYVTNSAGIVDEVSFQPRLVTGKRDARQTAVGREGLDTDVGGHIQGCSLGGTCDRVNLFPQDANFNNSAYKRLENEIRRALEAQANGGPTVGQVRVSFQRANPASPRPDGVIIEYNIGGRRFIRNFNNTSGG